MEVLPICMEVQSGQGSYGEDWSYHPEQPLEVRPGPPRTAWTVSGCDPIKLEESEPLRFGVGSPCQLSPAKSPWRPLPSRLVRAGVVVRVCT